MANPKAKMSADMVNKGVDSIVRNTTTVIKKTVPKKKPTLQDFGEMRSTFIVDIGLNDKIKSIAHWDRRRIKDVVFEAFEMYIKSYEEKKGKIKPIPEK